MIPAASGRGLFTAASPEFGAPGKRHGNFLEMLPAFGFARQRPYLVSGRFGIAPIFRRGIVEHGRYSRAYLFRHGRFGRPYRDQR